MNISLLLSSLLLTLFSMTACAQSRQSSNIDHEVYRSKIEYGLKRYSEHGHYEIYLTHLDEKEPFLKLKYRTKSRVISELDVLLTKSRVDYRVKTDKKLVIHVMVIDEGSVFTYSVWHHVDTLYVEDMVPFDDGVQTALVDTFAPPYRSTLCGGAHCVYLDTVTNTYYLKQDSLSVQCTFDNVVNICTEKQ